MSVILFDDIFNFCCKWEISVFDREEADDFQTSADAVLELLRDHKGYDYIIEIRCNEEKGQCEHCTIPTLKWRRRAAYHSHS